MALAFPAALAPRSIAWRLELASRSGGPTLTGAEQVVVSDAGRWRAVLGFPAVREEWILAVRALVAALDGRAGEVEVPVFDLFLPRDVTGRRLSPEPATLLAGADGGISLHDLSGLAQSGETHAALSSDAAAGATRLVAVAKAPDGSTVDAPWMIPRPGQYFGIGARLYIATRAFREDEGDPWTLDFRPRLRAAATTGTRLIVDRPVCTMRLAGDDIGGLDLDFGRFAAATLEFVEAV